MSRITPYTGRPYVTGTRDRNGDIVNVGGPHATPQHFNHFALRRRAYGGFNRGSGHRGSHRPVMPITDGDAGCQRGGDTSKRHPLSARSMCSRRLSGSQACRRLLSDVRFQRV
eukprot:6814388-Prymnesium_polylepis.2